MKLAKMSFELRYVAKFSDLTDGTGIAASVNQGHVVKVVAQQIRVAESTLD